MKNIYTTGHSTLSVGDFISMLISFDVQILADVRSYPGSRRNPQYNKNNLIQSLAESSIEYIHLPSLGGIREPVNLPKGRHHVFQGYIDHMNTQEFKGGIDELIGIAGQSTAAIMCAESDWRKCHRSLIADHLKSIDIIVRHITGVKTSEEHTYTKIFLANQPGLDFAG